jgi:hypothetical protein
VVIGLDVERDISELERLDLPPLSVEHIDSVLVPKYKSAGFEIFERGIIAPSEWPGLQTSWAKRLKGNQSRALIYLIARVC